jgi:hypothetical protein
MVYYGANNLGRFQGNLANYFAFFPLQIIIYTICIWYIFILFMCFIDLLFIVYKKIYK